MPKASCEESPRKRFNFIADVVDKAAAAVVFIEVIDFHPFFGNLVTVASGSGFIVDSNGIIVTNAHVLANRSKVSVLLKNGQKFDGFVEYADNYLDLATVKINAKNLPSLKLGKSSTLRPGEWVVAMGSPFSLTNTITAGVVSSSHRQSEDLGLCKEMEYIQTDASTNNGNSGGPLINLDAEVIGVNSMKVTAGISFAIPSDYITEFLKRVESLRKSSTSTPKKFYMGLTMLSLTPQIVQQLRMQKSTFPDVNSGVLVMKVILGSPAHLAGVLPRDVIVSVNGKEVMNVAQLYKFLDSGEKLVFTVIREGNQKVNITVSPQQIR